MTYQKQLQDPRWKARRLKILQRDHYRCYGCGRSWETASLEVHHRWYERGRLAWEYPSEALRSLCRPCHALERFAITDESDRTRERNEKRRELGLPPVSSGNNILD